MAKQTINIGTTANDRTGDPLRTAFTKVNENFSELYTNVATLTTDYNSISNSDFIPDINNAYDLGSPTKQWHSLYISSNTIFVGGSSISINDSGKLLVDDVQISAETGNITFDDVKIIGSSSNTIIELVPDNDLYSADQYLIIDPVAPSQIHIRAGGIQDQSSANLFLGGEKKHVRITDTTGVNIQNETVTLETYPYSANVDFTDSTWYANNDVYYIQYTVVNLDLNGIVFDDVESIAVTYAGGSTDLTYGGTATYLGEGVYKVQVNEEPPSNPTVLTDIEYNIYITRTSSVSLENDDFNVTVADDIRITANDIFSLRNTSLIEGIEIRTDYDGYNYVWRFAPDGSTNLPDGKDLIFFNNGEAGRIKPSISSGSGIQISTSNEVEIKVDTSIWNFDSDGNLNVPGNINSSGVLELNGNTVRLWGEGVFSNSYINLPNNNDSASIPVTILNIGDAGVLIQTGGTPYNWTFGSDGSLMFPDDTSQTTAYTGLSEGISKTTDASIEIGSEIVFEGYIDNGLGGDSGATLHVTNVISGTLYDGMIIYGGSLPTEGWALSFGTVVEPQGSGGVGNYYLAGANYLTTSETYTNPGTIVTWDFGTDGSLTFPDSTQQLTAFTGNAITVDVLATNSSSTTMYPTFVNATSGNVTIRADQDLTYRADNNLLTVGNVNTNILKLDVGVQETLALTAGIGSGVNDLDCSLGHTTYNTSVSANWTVNLVNLNLDSQRTTTITIIIEQGATGYYPDALQIAGVSETINWQGNTTPTPSSNRTDVVTFSIIRHDTGFGSGYTVLGKLTGF